MYTSEPGVGFSVTDAYRRLRKWQPGKDIVKAAKRQAGVPEGQAPPGGYSIDITPKDQKNLIFGLSAGTAAALGVVLFLALRRKK